MDYRPRILREREREREGQAPNVGGRNAEGRKKRRRREDRGQDERDPGQPQDFACQPQASPDQGVAEQRAELPPVKVEEVRERKREKATGPSQQPASVFVGGISGMEALVRAIPSSDLAAMKSFSPNAVADHYFQATAKTIALGYHACVQMMEYHQASREMERQLLHMKEEVISAKNEARLLKVHANKACAELQKSMEACSQLNNEKKKLIADLQGEECKVLALELKLRGLELQRMQDLIEGIAAFQKTPQFEQLVKDKIEEHMQGEDALYEIAKHWDCGYEAFRKQAQALYPDWDFSLIRPMDEPTHITNEETEVDDGGAGGEADQEVEQPPLKNGDEQIVDLALPKAHGDVAAPDAAVS